MRWLVVVAVLGSCRMGTRADAVPETDPPSRDPSSSEPSDSDHRGSVTDSDRVETDVPGLLDGPRYASGTRLRVSVWASGDGEALAELFDTALGVRCEPAEGADGVVRCLPVVGDTVARFADAACGDTLFAMTTAACSTSPFARVRSEVWTACGFGPRRVVLPLRPVAVPATVWTDEPRCSQATVEPGTTFWDLDPLRDVPVDPATLVGFGIVDVPGPHGVGVRFLVGEDGTRIGWGLVDGAGACAPEVFSGGPRCVPLERAEAPPGGAWGAAECEGTLLGVDRRGAACAPPRLLVRGGEEALLYAIGAPWSGLAWQRDATGCRSVPNTVPLYEAGPPVDPASLPSLIARGAGTGPLRVTVWDDAAGLPLLADPRMPLALADGRGCTPTLLVDRRSVCLPRDAPRLLVPPLWFADPGCAVRLTDARVDGDVAYVLDEGCGEDGTALSSAWRLGPAHSGVVYFASGGGCVASGVVASGLPWRTVEQVDAAAVWPELVAEAR